MASLTFRPKSKTAAVISVEVPSGCVGIIIGKGGKNIKALAAAHPGTKIQGPRRDAVKQMFRVSGADKAKVRAAAQQIRDTATNWQKRNAQQQQRQAQQQLRKSKMQEAWTQHIQDISGCTGGGWETAGSAAADAWRKRQLAKQESTKISYKRPGVIKNRFELPSDSEDEEEQRGPAIVKARAPTGAWSKGAPKPVSPVKLERQTADMGEQPSPEQQKELWDEIVANHKPITSWADACDSDDEE